MMMKICGLQKTTLLDYPGHMAATVFLGGCNFRCPYCHNSDLLGNRVPPLMRQGDLLDFLKSRQGILEGICISGGEPTMDQAGLFKLAADIKELGFLIKLDTNGTHPEILKQLSGNGLLDYISMDIKTSLQNYPYTVGNRFVALDRIKESAAWLIAGTLPFEFRTTVVKGLHTAADFAEIGPWIAGAPHYFLQNYLESDRILNPTGLGCFSKQELLGFCDLLKPYVHDAALRGVD